MDGARAIATMPVSLDCPEPKRPEPDSPQSVFYQADVPDPFQLPASAETTRPKGLYTWRTRILTIDASPRQKSNGAVVWCGLLTASLVIACTSILSHGRTERSLAKTRAELRELHSITTTPRDCDPVPKAGASRYTALLSCHEAASPTPTPMPPPVDERVFTSRVETAPPVADPKDRALVPISMEPDEAAENEEENDVEEDMIEIIDWDTDTVCTSSHRSALRDGTPQPSPYALLREGTPVPLICSGNGICAWDNGNMIHDMSACDDERRKAESRSVIERLHVGGLVHASLRIRNACGQY